MFGPDYSMSNAVDRNSGCGKARRRVCVQIKLYEHSNIWPGQCLDSDSAGCAVDPLRSERTALISGSRRSDHVSDNTSCGQSLHQFNLLIITALALVCCLS